MGEQLLWGIKNGDLDAVRSVIEAKGGTNVNEALVNGRMSIHYAADYGQAEVLQYLVSHGADVNIQDKHGITPLLAAIFEGHVNCAELLIGKGAKTDGRAPNGDSYLQCAETDELKLLLSRVNH